MKFFVKGRYRRDTPDWHMWSLTAGPKDITASQNPIRTPPIGPKHCSPHPPGRVSIGAPGHDAAIRALSSLPSSGPTRPGPTHPGPGHHPMQVIRTQKKSREDQTERDHLLYHHRANSDASISYHGRSAKQYASTHVPSRPTFSTKGSYAEGEMAQPVHF